MKTALTVLLALIAAGCATARVAPQLSEKDAGLYGLVHTEGHLVSQMQLLFTQQEGDWALRVQRGTVVQGVACETSCLLKTSSQEDIAWLMQRPLPRDAMTACAHNSSLALCRVSQRGRTLYLLILINGRRHIPVQVVRISGASASEP